MTLMTLDGNSLAYRAFFALPTDMATASGQVTNAVFGFASMLSNLFLTGPNPPSAIWQFLNIRLNEKLLPTYCDNS
jgi:5'-3' exonuclease